jgi:hypothetical protein
MTGTTPAVEVRRPRRRSSDDLWTLAFAGGLGVLLPLLLVGDPTVPFRSSNHALVFLLCVFSATRLGSLLGSHRRQYLSISFYLFVYVWFGLAGIVQLDAAYFNAPEFFLGRGFSQETRLTATLIIWAGILAYEVGLRFGDRAPRRIWARRQLGPLRVHLLAAFSLASSALALLMAGSVSVLFSSREEFYATFGTRADGGYATLASDVALRIPVFVAAVLLIYLYRQPGGLRWSAASLGRRVLVIATVVTALLVNNIASSTRSIAGALAFAMVFAWVRPDQRLLRRVAFTGVLVAVLFVYPLANSFRRAESKVTGPATATTSLRDQLLYSAGFGMFGQVHIGVEYVQLDGHTFGRQLEGSALFLVPRTVWTTKPVDTGDMIHDAIGFPPRLNQSSPLWIEFYVDGGYPLVLIGFALYGGVSARVQRRFDSVDPFAFGALLVPLLAGYQLYVLRGSLLAATPRLAVLLGVTYLTTVATRRELLAPEAESVS